VTGTNIDTSTAVGALTSPFWVEWLRQGLDTYVLVGGAVLLTFRILIAFRDYRRKDTPNV
jgi:hypothetical protein